MTISIHLGAHKTATTHLQQSLRRIEPDLLDADRMFLGPVNLRQPPLDLRAMLNDPAAHPRNSQLARDLLRGLRREHSAMILSDELFLGGLGRERLLTAEGSFYQDGDRRLGHLLELLGTRDATLFLALRSPASFVTSVHAELVREGQKGRIEDYLGGFDPGRARWLPLVRRLLARLGRGRLIVWRFEDLAVVRRPLMVRLLGEPLADRVPDLPPLRVGLSASAYDRLLRDDHAATPDERRLLAEQALRHEPRQRPEQAPRPLPDAVHARASATYAEDCAQIAALPGVEFLRPSQGGRRQG